MELPTIPPSDDFRFRATRQMRWSDEDNQKVVNNAVYMTLLEEARFEYFTGLGLVEDNQFPFVLMQTNIRFLSPGRGGESVEVELKTTGFTRSAFTQVSRIIESVSRRVLVEAEVLLVSWSNAERKKALTSERFRTVVEQFEAGGEGAVQA
jgi:acyl-CoA thioester hydrolase